MGIQESFGSGGSRKKAVREMSPKVSDAQDGKGASGEAKDEPKKAKKPHKFSGRSHDAVTT